MKNLADFERYEFLNGERRELLKYIDEQNEHHFKRMENIKQKLEIVLDEMHTLSNKINNIEIHKD
jgi:hypothetical protein